MFDKLSAASLLPNHDLKVDFWCHRKLACVQLPSVQRSGHLIALEVEHGIGVHSLRVIKSLLQRRNYLLALGRPFWVELAKQFGHVKALHPLLKGVVSVDDLAQIGPVDSALEH